LRACISLSNLFLIKIVDNGIIFVFSISNKKIYKVTIVLIKIRQSNIVKQLENIKFLTIIKDIKFLLVVKDIEVLITIEDIIFLTTLINAIFEKKLCLFIMRRILY